MTSSPLANLSRLQSDDSAIVEECLVTIARRQPTTRFVKLHHEIAEMDHITAPALLAYRNSDVFATIVDVLRNIPKGRSCSADSLEDLLKLYVPVLSQFPFCYEPPTDPGLGTVYSELTKSSKLMYFPYSVLAQHQASRSHTSSDILALPSFSSHMSSPSEFSGRRAGLDISCLIRAKTVGIYRRCIS